MSRRSPPAALGTSPAAGAHPTSPHSKGSRRAGPSDGRTRALTTSTRRRPGTGLLHRHAPSTVSGSLHMGHVFSFTHTDTDRPLQADARVHGLVPDGLGRQRPANQKARPELLRGALRPEPALRGRLCPARRGWAAQRRTACGHKPAEFRRALRGAHRRGRACIQDIFRYLGLSVDWGHLYTTIGERRGARPNWRSCTS